MIKDLMQYTRNYLPVLKTPKMFFGNFVLLNVYITKNSQLISNPCIIKKAVKYEKAKSSKKA